MQKSLLLPAISAIAIYAAFSSVSASAAPAYILKQSETTLALWKADAVVWQLNFGDPDGKPYFHPLCLPDGTVATSLRPVDHPWHLGLWFSWKYINGVNYWEYIKNTQQCAGQTKVTTVNITKNDDFSAKVAFTLAYHLPGQPPVLTEKRDLQISAPDPDGAYLIDWISTFTAGEKDVTLDRTPLPAEKDGAAWGGYAGLSLRLCAAAKNWTFTADGRRQGAKQLHGKTAQWIDCSGPSGGVTITDFQENPRHPSPWYCWQSGMQFFSPAFLYNNSYQLPSGKSVTLKYRIRVHQ